MSNVIQRIVAEQTRVHLSECELMPSVQSAYRQGHSTESALMKVIADILDATDHRKVTLMGLLDMSAAFDTVDHEIILWCLKVSYGIDGQALRWLASFLTDRTEVVADAGVNSTLKRLLYSIPQGSVLGHLLFVLYSADVIQIAATCIATVSAFMHTMMICRPTPAAPPQTTKASKQLNVACYRVLQTSSRGCRQID